MKVAITGASGDIGGSVMARLSESYPVNTLVREGADIKSSGSHKSIERFVFRDGYSYKDDFLSRLADADAIVHCAGALNSPDRPLAEYVAANALLTGLLAAIAGRGKPSKFVYFSSEMIYGLRNDPSLHTLADNFVTFCRAQFSTRKASYNLRALADKFISQNKDFSFEKYNAYALTKYLGEVASGSLPNAVIVRVTNAYGPGYDNPRLIPRLIVGRLTGHGASYVQERRDFVFCNDINRLVEAVIVQDTSGVIDCKSGESTSTKDLRDAIIRLTPTAYGKLVGEKAVPRPSPKAAIERADTTLADVIGQPTPFTDGLNATLRYHKEQCYHQMADTRTMEEFLEPDEELTEVLKGSSAAYLFVVRDKQGVRKVRKIAIRDGVEGNGIAKVANEIRYYEYIAERKPGLASLYPKLLASEAGRTFSSETIEYLEGPNYYTALQSEDLPFKSYHRALERFIDDLCVYAIEDAVPAADPENALNTLYLERSLSRLHSIDRILERGDTLRVNGRELTAPHIILTNLLEDTELRKFILPRVECFCFHGDLTLLNTVFLAETERIRLIDPRGSTDAWDPIYDFAKLKFTLSGFGEFILGEEPMVVKSKDGFTVDFNRIPAFARKLHESMLAMLERNEQFREKIAKHEPYWQHRLALAEATHYLADIPFRLFTDATSWSAVSSYVLGTYYLNDVYEALKHEHTPSNT